MPEEGRLINDDTVRRCDVGNASANKSGINDEDAVALKMVSDFYIIGWRFSCRSRLSK